MFKAKLAKFIKSKLGLGLLFFSLIVIVAAGFLSYFQYSNNQTQSTPKIAEASGGCGNWATNFPSCNICPAGLTWSVYHCVTPCPNGSSNPINCFGSGECPDGKVWKNGACEVCPYGYVFTKNVAGASSCVFSAAACPAPNCVPITVKCDPITIYTNNNNPQSCNYNYCPSGYTLSNDKPGICSKIICSNGNVIYNTINFPSCNVCRFGQLFDAALSRCVDSCPNGGINYPNCTRCPTGQTLAEIPRVGRCAIPRCQPGFISDATTHDNGTKCTAIPCTNGAIDAPGCRTCPAGFSFNATACVLSSSSSVSVVSSSSIISSSIASSSSVVSISSSSVTSSVSSTSSLSSSSVTPPTPGEILVPLENITFSPLKSDRKQFKAGDLKIKITDSRLDNGATCDIFNTIFPSKTTASSFTKLSSGVALQGQFEGSLPQIKQEKAKFRFKISCTNPTTSTKGYSSKTFVGYPDYAFKYGAISLVEASGKGQ